MKPESDIYDGVRAVSMGKGQKAEWSLTLWQDVTVDMVESYFEELVDNCNTTSFNVYTILE